MSRTSTAVVNQQLTNYAQGRMNDLMQARAIIAALAPSVPVSGATGQYKVFDDRNSFLTYNTARGIGGSARRIEFAGNDAAFSCTPQALEVMVDDFEREQAGDSPLAQQLLDEGKVKALLNVTMLSHVKKVVDFVMNNVTAEAGQGDWSDDAIDPVDQLDKQLATLATDVGSGSFISITMGLQAWRSFRAHPKVKARCSGVQVAGISVDQARGLFMLPLQDFIVGSLSYTATKPGQSTVTKANVVGDNVLLSYAVPSPTIYDPSPFKVFSTGVNNIASVRTYRAESNRADVHAIDWSEDIRKTSTLGVKRLSITTRA